MPVRQSDIDSFHSFATQFLAKSNRELTLEELLLQWRNELQQEEAIDSIRRGVTDADAGRVRNLAEVDAAIRGKLGLAPRGE